VDLTVILDCAQFLNLLSDISGNGCVSVSFKERKVILSWTLRNIQYGWTIAVHNLISIIIVTSVRGEY